MVEYHLAINRTKSIPQCGWSPKILCWRKEARHKSPHSMWFCLYERGYASKNGEEPLPIFPPQKQWENWQMWSKSTSLQVLIINQRLAVICKAFIPEKKKKPESFATKYYSTPWSAGGRIDEFEATDVESGLGRFSWIFESQRVVTPNTCTVQGSTLYCKVKCLLTADGIKKMCHIHAGMVFSLKKEESSVIC